MDTSMQEGIEFPKDLIEWAGHHAGGVKRLFDSRSGRPGKTLLRTKLISMLEVWAKDAAIGTAGTPRILLLVGGPGNGKTEAIEHTIKCFDQELGAGGRLIERLSTEFLPPEGQSVPRIVSLNAGLLGSSSGPLEIQIVQDASVTAGHDGRSAPALLIEELGSLLDAPQSTFYLCCVNRGVLDDALIHALDHDLANVEALLEAITRSVSLSANAPSCWPLEDFPSIAIWPMDAESLLTIPEEGTPAPAAALLEHATTTDHWPKSGACPAGANCPFCQSQALLSREEHRSALLQMLRWYELASGKRWSFRDLFSLVSYLLAGNRQTARGQETDPCQWAAHLLALDENSKTGTRPEKQQLTALFHLATSTYQHALFHSWDSSAARPQGSGPKRRQSRSARTLRACPIPAGTEKPIFARYHFIHPRGSRASARSRVSGSRQRCSGKRSKQDRSLGSGY
jgi:hypothetical protein